MSANIGGMGPVSAAPHVDAAQMNQFCSFVNMLGDPNAKDEMKLKAAQELSENFELITQCSRFGAFLEHSMKIFIKILQDGEPHFISEYNIQQVSARVRIELEFPTKIFFLSVNRSANYCWK